MKIIKSKKTYKAIRRRYKEFGWVRLRNALLVPCYIVRSNDGKSYMVCAQNMPDAAWLYDYRLDIASYDRDCDTHFEKRKDIGIISAKKGKVKHLPFWCYGRIYELREVH